jgi:alpha-amylase
MSLLAFLFKSTSSRLRRAAIWPPVIVGSLLGLARAFGTVPPPSDVVHPAWSYNATIYEVNVRQYTPEGTFNAFAQHLPRLQKMGVSVLWLMPINPIGEQNRKGSLGSYYSVRDYRAVNPEFGTVADLQDLVKQAHELGMYVILDWVANHCAWDNVLVPDHPDWFTHDSTGRMVPPVADWSDVVDLNYDAPGLRQYMTDALKYWVTECGVDGFRCDVAGMVPMDFWDHVRRDLSAIKPVFMLAEDENPLCHQRAFDMTYAWSLHHLLRDIAHGKQTVAELDRYFPADSAAYPRGAYRMLFTDNHDENSWNGPVTERMRQGIAAFAVLTATAPGMPLVYTGQEAGLHRSLKFFDKDTVNWTTLPLQKLYTVLLQLKRSHPALQNGERGGSFTRLSTSADSSVFAYVRERDGAAVVAVLNLSGAPVNVKLTNRAADGRYTDVFSGEALELTGASTLDLPAWSYRLLRR